MKTPNTNKLGFAKKDLVELNSSQLNDVNGGSTPLCSGSVIISLTLMTTKDLEDIINS